MFYLSWNVLTNFKCHRCCSKHFISSIISLNYFTVISFGLYTISPQRKKALKANKIVFWKYSIEQFFFTKKSIDFNIFAKIGPVIGNLESLLGADCLHPSMIFLTKNVSDGSWRLRIFCTYIIPEKLEDILFGEKTDKQWFCIIMHNHAGERGIEVTFGKCSIRRFHVFCRHFLVVRLQR